MDFDLEVNDYAIRSFRDQADADYIGARMAFRARLVMPCLWESLQTIEKYLKCILLLNRIPAKVGHNLDAAIKLIDKSGKLALNLSAKTIKFVEHLDSCAQSRYLEVSNVAFGRDIVQLDRAAWELRRFCTLDNRFQKIVLQNGVIPPKIRIADGYLESIIDDKSNPAREPLLWNNAFFGLRRRRHVKLKHGSKRIMLPCISILKFWMRF